jgi:hypothetical protein
VVPYQRLTTCELKLPLAPDLVPLWLKLAYTAFVLVMVPVYWLKAAAGPRNFLWFSDIALFGGLVALWLESSLVASTMTVMALLPELTWNLSFFARLFTGRTPVGLADYMFDPEEHWYMRTLSLFHIFMPVVLVWLVARLGYDDRALVAATGLAWIVVPLSYVLTEPRHNINRVFGPGGKPQRSMHPLRYLVLLLAGLPLLAYVPAHFLLRALFGG